MGIPGAFTSTPMLNAVYERTEKQYLGFIKSKARRYERKTKGMLEYDELVQEGRCALMHALGSYDASRGKPMHVYLGRILDNTYRDMITRLLNPTNCPHIWRRDEDGEWARVPHPALALEGASADEDEDGASFQVADDATPNPEEAASLSESETRARVFVLRLQGRLGERELNVLGCLRQPDAGLLVTARNITGAYNINNIHIAAYLGVTRYQVESSVHAIRVAACDILSEMALGGDMEAATALEGVIHV